MKKKICHVGMPFKTDTKKLVNLPFIPGSAVKDGRYRGRDRLLGIQLMSDFYPAEGIVVIEKVNQFKVFNVVHTENGGQIEIPLIEEFRHLQQCPKVNVEGKMVPSLPIGRL